MFTKLVQKVRSIKVSRLPKVIVTGAMVLAPFAMQAQTDNPLKPVVDSAQGIFGTASALAITMLTFYVCYRVVRKAVK